MALPFWWRKVSFLSLFQVLDLESPMKENLWGLMGLPPTWQDHLKVFKPKGWVPLPLVGINLNRIPTGQSGPFCKLKSSTTTSFVLTHRFLQTSNGC